MLDDAMRRLQAANPVAAAPPVRSVDDVIAGWGAAAAPEPGRAADTLHRSVAGRVTPTTPPEADPTGGTAAPAPSRRAPWRATGLSVVLALAVGTGSAAAALTAFTGHPIPQSTDTVTVRPAAGTTHVSTVRAVDPDGGPPWGLRIGTAPGGLQC
ncbi:MAG: hypothetical protein AAGC46_18495, partial [Solirubrobacteraceae bacterium]